MFHLNSKIASNTSAAAATPKRIAVLLSGGVDSSVALTLLAHQYPSYIIHAYYLKIWLEDEISNTILASPNVKIDECPWEDDYLICQSIVSHLQETIGRKIPLYSISLQNEYRDSVLQYTLDESRKGRTPNPDVVCNSRVKFGVFWETVGKEYDYVASGHYAILQNEQQLSNNGGDDNVVNNKIKMYRSPDPVKDQSYFLCTLTQQQLSRTLFPIGHYTKPQIRALAHHYQLPNRSRPDSQGLCFLGKVQFDQFLKSYLGTDPGLIRDANTREIVGKHNGLWFHTVGQRKGLGPYLNPKSSAHGPWYVVAKKCKEKEIWISNKYNNNDSNNEDVFDIARKEFVVEDIKWLGGVIPMDMFQVKEEAVNDHGGGRQQQHKQQRARWFFGPNTRSSIKRDTTEHQEQNKKKQRLVGRFAMKIRHGPNIVLGTLSLTLSPQSTTASSLSIKITKGQIILDIKDKGLAPGQFVALYQMDNDSDEKNVITTSAVSNIYALEQIMDSSKTTQLTGECVGSGVISDDHWEQLFLSS